MDWKLPARCVEENDNFVETITVISGVYVFTFFFTHVFHAHELYNDKKVHTNKITEQVIVGKCTHTAV